jgi:hypothetical protein
MQLQSLKLLTTSAWSTLQRFPFVLGAAAVAAVGWILGIEYPDQFLYLRLASSAALGIPLFVALALLAERRAWRGAPRAAAEIGGVLVLLLFFLLWSRWPEASGWMRFFHLAVALHLLVAVLPYAGVDEPNGFWHYNKSLFLRILTALLFSWVLWGGLAVALRAIEMLLGIDVPVERYPETMVLVFYLFNTWYFLGGVPRDLPALEGRGDYPAVLKVFSQYILVPIVTVYLAILSIYLVRVIITWVWPSGWIGWLVSGVAAAGILALLLVYPVREREENRWIGQYARWFYIVLFPSIVMLWLAIWQRVDQYGVTERRYFLAILSIWLAGIAVYYTLRGSRKIIVIPASLCVVGLATLIGPWSAYAVSRRSQTGRLEELLTRNDLLEEGAVRPAEGDVPYLDRREISAVVRYLLEAHGPGAISPWFGEELVAAADTTDDGTGSAYDRVDGQARAVVAQLGLAYVDRWQRGTEERFDYFAAASLEAVAIAGYHYVLRVDRDLFDSTAVVGEKRLACDSVEVSLRLIHEDGVALAIPLEAAIDRAAAHRQTGGERGIPRDSLYIVAEDDRALVAVYVSSIAGRHTAAGPVLSSLAADVYVRVK